MAAVVGLAGGGAARAQPPRNTGWSRPLGWAPGIEGPRAVRGGAAVAPWLGAAGAAAVAGNARGHGAARPRVTVPDDFGSTIRPGEKFRFDVTFAGNPAGLAVAQVRRAPPPEPWAGPVLQLVGSARTSGVVSLLAQVTDEMVTTVDARSGAPVYSRNEIRYDGIRLSYRRRTTDTYFYGRGFVVIEDRKDDGHRVKSADVPADTFDPLSAMAWVRSLRLQPGEVERAHVADGMALLRLEVVSRGREAPNPMPALAASLRIGPDQIERIDGRLTRIEPDGRPVDGAKSHTLRAYVSTDGRRLPLRMETDMWVGRLRLELTHYDPPSAARGAGERGAS